MKGRYLNEPVTIVETLDTHYSIRFADGFVQIVPKSEVTIYSKQIRKRNPKRAKRKFVRNFGSSERANLIQKTPCIICSNLPSQNVHTKSRGAGGDWSDIVPMCAEHHQELHKIGIKTFEAKYEVDLSTTAKDFAIKYPKKS